MFYLIDPMATAYINTLTRLLGSDPTQQNICIFFKGVNKEARNSRTLSLSLGEGTWTN